MSESFLTASIGGFLGGGTHPKSKRGLKGGETKVAPLEKKDISLKISPYKENYFYKENQFLFRKGITGNTLTIPPVRDKCVPDTPPNAPLERGHDVVLHGWATVCLRTRSQVEGDRLALTCRHSD